MSDQTIFTPGIVSAEAFGTAQLTTGPVTISAFGIPSGESFGGTSVGNITAQSIDSQERFGVPRVTALSRFPTVTPQLADQFPTFVREDHENFLLFMEAYYEWLESYGQIIYNTKNLLNIQDIDTTVDRFVQFFQKEFLVNIPSQMVADKAMVLKNIREYYRARGTEKSYKFFFRILFGQEASFYFPRTDILRVSDGKWIQNVTLRVSADEGDPFQLLGRKIRGVTNNSTAFVEDVHFVQEGYVSVYELFLNRSSITGEFAPEEIIKTNDGSNIVCHISPLPLEITVTNGGLGYQEGQAVNITGTGAGATAKIISVDSLTGEVKKVQITNYGAAYFGVTSVAFPFYPGVTEVAEGTVTVGALTRYPGYYLNQDGQLSTTKYLQDGFYYQQFSYVIKVNESVNLYRDALKKALHPAGLIFFGTLLSENTVSARMRLPTSLDGSDSTMRLHMESFLKLDTKTHFEMKIIHWLKEAEDSYKLGPSYRSLERDKFSYKPSVLFDSNAEMQGGINTGYWSGPVRPYANYQIKDFKDLTIKEVTQKPWTKINIMPEPSLKTSTQLGIQSDETFGTPVVIS